MKLDNKKSAAVALIVSFTLVMAACSGSGSGSNGADASTSKEGGTGPSANNADSIYTAGGAEFSFNKPLQFSYFLNNNNPQKNWGEQPQTKWIQDHLKVTVTPIQSNGSADAKLNAMIVARELPDVINSPNAKLLQLFENDQLVALDPFMDKYPAFRNTIGDKIINMLRSKDGKLYQFPVWYNSSNKSGGNAAWLVEKKIYKSLGSPKLETFEELENYLKMVKEKYPDVIPLDGDMATTGIYTPFSMSYPGFGANKSPSFIMNGFPDGNQLKPAYEDPAFVKTSLYISKLFRQGLVSKDALAQTKDQLLEKMSNGRIAVYTGDNGVNEDFGRKAHNILKSKDSEDGYLAIWPIHAADVDKNSVFTNNFNPMGSSSTVITKNAKDPEAIFKFLTWMTTPEGQSIVFFGPEGLYWDKKDKNGYPIPNDAYMNRDQKVYDSQSIGAYNMVGNAGFVNDAKALADKMLPPEKQDWTNQAQTTITFKTAKDMMEFTDIAPSPSSKEGIIQQHFNDQFKQVIAKIYFANSDEEVLSIIKKANQDAADIGYATLLKWQTDKWQSNLKKMNP